MASKKSASEGPLIDPEVEKEILELRAKGKGPLSIRVVLSKKDIYVSVNEIRAVLAKNGAVPRSELTTATTKGRLTGFWSPPK
jgi:hypothetical protein